MTIYYDLSRAFAVIAGKENGEDMKARLLKIIPPIYQNSSWLSFNELHYQYAKHPSYLEYKDLLGKLYDSFQNSNLAEFKRTAQQINKISAELVNKVKYNAEIIYNFTDYILWAIMLYIAFLLLPKYRALFISANILNFIYIILRILIANRPPVSNLYESIIFIAFISSLLLYLLRYVKASAILGVILLSLSYLFTGYGKDIGQLEPVLNSNFWLTIHVIIIAIGYSISLCCSVIAIIYLLTKQKRIFLILVITMLFSLLFMVTGTLIGGIWADQSWGRFWGWDPKENGALLIILWQLFSAHMLILNSSNYRQIAVLQVITSLIVCFSWFGVNMLGVGLHSYGFAE